MPDAALNVFVQARMSSSRFPGKVLAPFKGRPIIDHVLDAAATALGADATILVTSTETSDDPLAVYAASTGRNVFRGPLDDVFGRFLACLEQNPCDWIMRLCADSPLLDPGLLRQAAKTALENPDADLVTNTFPRSFPHGQSVEVLRADTFRGLDPAALNDNDREHVTPFFYRNPERFRIVNIECPERFAGLDTVFTVDTLDDLIRLNGMDGPPAFFGRPQGGTAA